MPNQFPQINNGDSGLSVRTTLNQVIDTFGEDSVSSGSFSHAEGNATQAIGASSHAEGSNTQAIGDYSHAEGAGTIASGSVSHAEGTGAVSLGDYSHAEGESTQAIGASSHAEGYTTQTIGIYSHAEGSNAQAIGDYSHAEGDTTQAGWRAFTVIVSTGTASISNVQDFTSVFPAPSTIVTNTGLYTYNSSSYDGSHTNVYLDNVAASFSYMADISYLNELAATTLLGPYSHAEGTNAKTIGDYSHAEGNNSQAYGLYSHAEGSNTQAIGGSSHAEGTTTKAIGDASHAEGRQAQSLGEYSHAEGFNTRAVGGSSHAEGYGTIASGSYQHASGKFNTHGDDTSLFIIGNGVDDANRSDAFKVTPSGSIILPVTSSNTPGWGGTQGEMIFGDDGSGNYVIWAYLGGQWRSGSLA